MKPVFEEIWQLADPYLDTRDNDIHTRLSVAFAYRLLEREGGDEDVVIPAVILHDVGWKKVPEDLHLKAFGPNATLPELVFLHERKGAKIAEEILEQVNYEKSRRDEIIEIIRGHDSRKEPISSNDKLVKDADKLFRYTRESVTIYSKRFGLSYDEMLAKLQEKVAEWILTDSAREMVREEIADRLKERD